MPKLNITLTTYSNSDIFTKTYTFLGMELRSIKEFAFNLLGIVLCGVAGVGLWYIAGILTGGIR